MTSLAHDVRWPIRTERLTIRPATLDDLEATWDFRQHESVNRWLTRAPQTLMTPDGDPPPAPTTRPKPSSAATDAP
jgi:hypothetical protein